ncbi:unnamed protein product [Didymodactylos carnosus]|uniref:Uncharacterized protein n=1 Tax=Didymodactylos carnosus TaxID=1234261 RepID=A0A815ZDX0_9BILA|nr:unnamed protein product [Didymodactylos carnosus]CAF4449327.1 unnamed protein product [Didymodactylos carnosus]
MLEQNPLIFQSEYVLHISTQTDRVSLLSGDEADRAIEESGQEEDYSSKSENFYSEADSSLDDANDNNYVKENQSAVHRFDYRRHVQGEQIHENQNLTESRISSSL